MNFYKKIHNKIILFSKSKYAILFLFILALIEAVFFPIPPDVLLITLVLISRRKFFKYALYCTLGSIIGGSIGYYIGNVFWWNGYDYSELAKYLMNNISFFSEDIFLIIQEQFKKYGFLIIFTAGFTPIPYKIFSISAGINDISFSLFLLSSIISRSLRFFIIAGLLYYYGDKIKLLIEKYFNKFTFIIIIIIIIIYLFSIY